MENKKSQYVKILREICAQEGITLRSYSGDWAFQLEKDGKKAFILGYQFGLNVSSVQLICSDKNIASEILRQAGIPCVFHQCYMAPQLQSYIGADGNWGRLLHELECCGTLVCKDNYGTGGNQVYLVRNARELEAAAAQIFSVSQAMAVCPYEEIRTELRLVVLDGVIRLAFEKLRPQLAGDGVSTVGELFAARVAAGELEGLPVPPAGELGRILPEGESYVLNWKHNLGQGARARRLEISGLGEELFVLAARTCEALRIRFASIDLIFCQGTWKVLEVNSGVMMEHFAATCPEYYREAKQIYRDAILKMLSE